MRMATDDDQWFVTELLNVAHLPANLGDYDSAVNRIHQMPEQPRSMKPAVEQHSIHPMIARRQANISVLDCNIGIEATEVVMPERRQLS